VATNLHQDNTPHPPF